MLLAQVIPDRRSQYRSYAVIFGLLLFGAARSQAVPPDSALVLTAAQALDVRTGTYLKGAAVYVEGERISAVGRATGILERAPASVKRVDLGDATLLPGLIDCHTHLMARLARGPNAYALNLLTKSLSRQRRYWTAALDRLETLAAAQTPKRRKS